MSNFDDAVKLANIIGQVVQAVVPLIEEYHRNTGTYPSAAQMQQQLLGDEQDVLAKGQAWLNAHLTTP